LFFFVEPSNNSFIIQDEKGEIRAASFNKLVQELTSEKQFGKFWF